MPGSLVLHGERDNTGGMAHQDVVTVGGHRITLTNLDKVLYPETGTTKAEVAAYYAAVAEVMIPHVRDRPATRKRWVNGVGTADKAGQVFFQKNLDDATPDWVTRRTIEHSDHSNEYPLVNNVATLTWLAQIAALEIHVPQWRFRRDGTARNPDRMVLDLDPGPGVGLAECAEVARLARTILTGMGLDPMPVTSGSKGIHLYAALDGKQTSDDVSAIAHELARALEADHPDLVVSDMKRSLRDNKVLVDWSQNNASKTTIAPYSLRGTLRPFVAAPRTWRELASPKLAQLEYPEVLRRIAKRGDPLAALSAGSSSGQNPGATPEGERADGPDGEPDGEPARDRLHVYRSRRDPTITPEPVPAHTGEFAATAGEGRSFVIQEHHARALHWDFRLEHNGVLVSWALPKGVPTTPKQNHLAVQTEEHPLEYGSFEGEIPRGEYGAGTVSLWDTGTYTLEKWREGKEVIVVLHGDIHGDHRYALIHTGGSGGSGRSGQAPSAAEKSNWLIHLMAPDNATPAEDEGNPDGTANGGLHRTSNGTTTSLSRRKERPLTPMLATVGAATDDFVENEWAFEMKWDGYRALATLSGGSTRLLSRNGVDLTANYPELARLADDVEGDAVIDGEIVAFDGHGRPSFSRLQKRAKLHRSADITAATRENPVRFIAFDILEATTPGRAKPVSLLTHNYDERRNILERVTTSGKRLQVPPAFDSDLAAALEASESLGLEGVMAKRRDSPYSPGRRSRAWVKIKHQHSQEVVIGGWRPGKGKRADSIGSLLMGIPAGDGLHYVGRVGTGFDDDTLDALRAELDDLAITDTPFFDIPPLDAAGAHWAQPVMVGEVEFAEWTATGKLRQPTWRGLRLDKAPEDVVKE
ncbi:MAG: ATP-dependent ligase [Glaciihabitans sp.]|nr:ATP-dependent ligase [Glaciihabitans sp.]